MDAQGLITLDANAVAFVSIAIGVLAIGLSVVFYNWSTRLQRDASKALSELTGMTQRLEQLFEKFYSDTFGMVKETYTDMHRQAFPQVPDEKAEAEATEKRIEELVAPYVDTLKETLKRATEKEANMESLVAETRGVLEDAVRRTEESAKDQAVGDAMDFVIAELDGPFGDNMTVGRIVNSGGREKIPVFDIVRGLHGLERDGEIVLLYSDGKSTKGTRHMSPEDIVRLATP